MKLKSLAFTGAESGMMAGMMGGGMMGGSNVALPHGAELTIMRVKVDREVMDNTPLPERLGTIQRYRLDDAINRQNPRTFGIAMQRMKTWTINGRVFEMEGVANDEIVKLNTLEAWEFVNQTKSMDQRVHPMHIHRVQFQVIERQIAPQFKADGENRARRVRGRRWEYCIVVAQRARQAVDAL